MLFMVSVLVTESNLKTGFLLAMAMVLRRAMYLPSQEPMAIPFQLCHPVTLFHAFLWRQLLP
jgi:hypothetical protein